MKTSESYLKETPSDSKPLESDPSEKNDEPWRYGTKSLSKIDRDITQKDGSRYRGTRQSISFDVGTNNYLTDGKFPDDRANHSVRPLGSIYFAINSIYRTRMSRVAFLEWGFGASIYNFKFQNDSVKVSTGPTGVEFNVDNRALDFRKSQLSALFLNLSAQNFSSVILPKARILASLSL